VALGTVEALERLGCEAEITVIRSAGACVECCGEGEVDLLVVDRDLGADFERILEARRGDGPPIVVVSRDASDAAALDAFRRGASDCVSAGSAYADVWSRFAAGGRPGNGGSRSGASATSSATTKTSSRT
jgi:CheY-like chemotaxis protein